MEQKPGYKTTEFWVASVSGVFIAIMGILVGYGYATEQQSQLWTDLFIATAPLALMGISWGYGSSRATAKGQ